MKTTRSRMLLVFVAAALMISLFMHWDDAAKEFERGRDIARTDPVRYK